MFAYLYILYNSIFCLFYIMIFTIYSLFLWDESRSILLSLRHLGLLLHLQFCQPRWIHSRYQYSQLHLGYRWRQEISWAEPQSNVWAKIPLPSSADFLGQTVHDPSLPLEWSPSVVIASSLSPFHFSSLLAVLLVEQPVLDLITVYYFRFVDLQEVTYFYPDS